MNTYRLCDCVRYQIVYRRGSNSPSIVLGGGMCMDASGHVDYSPYEAVCLRPW
jgi:hypothetical protein